MSLMQALTWWWFNMGFGNYGFGTTPFGNDEGGGGENTVPIAYAGSSSAIVLPTNSIKLDSSYTDDGAVTVQWVKISGDPGTLFDDDTIIQPTITFTTAGTYIFQVTVTDGEALFDTDQVTIVVYNLEDIPVNTGKKDRFVRDNIMLYKNGIF